MCYPCTQCNKCGKFPPEGYCPECTHQNEADAILCEKCGYVFPKVPLPPGQSMKFESF